MASGLALIEDDDDGECVDIDVRLAQGEGADDGVKAADGLTQDEDVCEGVNVVDWVTFPEGELDEETLPRAVEDIVRILFVGVTENVEVPEDDGRDVVDADEDTDVDRVLRLENVADSDGVSVGVTLLDIVKDAVDE